MTNIQDFLNAQILLKDEKPNKLELNLAMLLSKESFDKVIKENVSKTGTTDTTKK